MTNKIKRYQVLNSLTKEEIKNIGVNRYFRRIFRKYWYIFAIEALALVVPTLWMDAIGMTIPDYYSYPILILLLVNLGWFNYAIFKKGNDFWDKVKDIPEPMDLREIK